MVVAYRSFEYFFELLDSVQDPHEINKQVRHSWWEWYDGVQRRVCEYMDDCLASLICLFCFGLILLCFAFGPFLQHTPLMPEAGASGCLREVCSYMDGPHLHSSLQQQNDLLGEQG